MASVLPLFKQSLLQAREMLSHGRRQDATRVFERLSRFTDLPTDVATEVYAGLGKIAHENGSYRLAVRHFTMALNHSPSNALALYLRARSLAAAGMKQFKRACDDLRSSLENNPSSASSHSLLGWLLCKGGMEKLGLEHHCRAVELRPCQSAYLRRLVNYLMLTQRWEEARAAITRALFLNRKDKRFQSIWNQFQFLQAKADQENCYQASREKVVLLPFLKLAQEKVSSKGTRYDGPESLPTPHATKARIIRTKRRMK